MRTILKLERFRDGKLVEVREQLSHSYTLDFMRLFFTQVAQVSTYNGVASSTLGLSFPAGLAAYGIARGSALGIVVGRGVTAASPFDSQLEYPIGYGRQYLALQPQLVNPSFETGDLTGWAGGAGSSAAEAHFDGSGGKYVWYRPPGTIDLINITQSVDFTNVSAISVAYLLNGHYFNVPRAARIWVYMDTTQLWFDEQPTAGQTLRDAYVPVSAAGAHVLKLEVYNGWTDTCYTMVDKVQLYGAQLEIGGSECTYPTFSGGTGEMTLRRFFYNRCGSSITINEVGFRAYPGRLILRDVVSPGVALAHGETLRATYQMQIIV